MAERVKNKSGLLEKVLKVLFNIVIFSVCLIAFILIAYVFSAQVHKNDKSYKPYLSFYTIVSPSMNPVIKVYDVVVNTRVSRQEDIDVGDIITYVSTNSTSEGMTITHRVVAISKAENGNYEYQTQGDNNSEPDGVLVTFENVIGKKIFVIPKLGRVQFLLANKKGWFALLLIPILLFVFKDIYDLIELFGLRKKVDEVAGYVEEPSYVIKNKKEKEQKEILKRELSIHEVRRDALIRKVSEGEGFLDPYTENVVEVGKPLVTKVNVKEEIEPIKIIKADKIEGKEIIANTDDEEINERIKEIKPVISPIEVLDADELTQKIKTYDQKIAELNEMLIDLEKMKNDKEKEIDSEREKLNEEIAKEKEAARKEIEEEKTKAREEIDSIKKKTENPKKEIKKNPKKIVDNYLIGRKIKVVNTVDVKKRKEKPSTKADNKIVLGNNGDGFNARLVVERPAVEDLPKLKEEKIEETINKKGPVINKRELKLREDLVSKKTTKISSKDVVLKELNTINKKHDSDLLFNPKIVKKVEINKDKKKPRKKAKKNRFIYIVKETKGKRN